MNPWFRFYHNTLDNPKAQRLPDKLFKAWVNCLCLACRRGDNGTLPPIADVAFALRCSEKEAANTVAYLASVGLLDRDGDTFRMHDWEEHQFISDSSTERVKRFRQRSSKLNGGASGNGHATGGGTGPDSEQIRTEGRRARSSSYEPPAAPPMSPQERRVFLDRHASTIKNTGQKPYFVTASDVAEMVTAELLTPEQAARCTG